MIAINAEIAKIGSRASQYSGESKFHRSVRLSATRAKQLAKKGSVLNDTEPQGLKPD